MSKSVKYFVLFAALFGLGAAPALAQGKGARGREEQPPSGAKADRGQGGEASSDRSNRAQSRREKSDGESANTDKGQSSNKRRR
jgi:hypothetical protein